MDSIIQQIEQALKEPVTRHAALQGGDINECFCIDTATTRYFLKLNDAVVYPGMFEQEAAGLAALRHNGNLVIPKVVMQGTFADKQWLLLQWLEKQPSTEGA